MSFHPQPDIFSEGESFRGYSIVKLLGKGGLGAVYLARHEMLDAFYAVKVLYPWVATESPDFFKRFLREAKIATRVRHPNLVEVHDCGFDQERGLYYLVMDYVGGGTLREAIAFSGKIGCDEAARIVVQVASALEAASRYNIVHRDIKPENIMLKPDGTVKLVDLGIAKADGLKDSLRTTAESMFGTPTYISPEQAISAADVDVRADIYSLGIVFFRDGGGTSSVCRQKRAVGSDAGDERRSGSRCERFRAGYRSGNRDADTTDVRKGAWAENFFRGGAVVRICETWLRQGRN